MANYNRPKYPPGAVIIRGTGPRKHGPILRRIPWRRKPQETERQGRPGNDGSRTVTTNHVRSLGATARNFNRA